MIPTDCHLKHSDPEILLPKICETGRCRLRTDHAQDFERLPVLHWDEGEPWQFRVAVERTGNNWTLRGILQRGNERLDISEPVSLLQCGVLVMRDSLARLDHGASFPWILLLRSAAKIQAPLDHGMQLVAEILKSPHPPPVDWPEELRLEEVAVAPRTLLRFSQARAHWEKEKFRGQLFFEYAGELIALRHMPQGYTSLKRINT
jgi:hypothetical protein